MLKAELTLDSPRENQLRAPTSHQLENTILRELAESLGPPSPAGRLWMGFLLCLVLAGLAAYIYQLVNGLKVTAMREYVSWGVYMTNFVFFIGVSHAGTLISAILRVTNAEWRRSITRMAEAITVFALIVGAPMVIIDMGRPDRILNVILHGRISSPILWDVFSICTYICGSILYLYVALIPDLALLCPPAPVWEKVPWRKRVYRFLALGYRGTPEQRVLLEKALATMAVIIIPVAVSVHTVVSWIFGMTLRPGWHSTIFGPYFVIGAIFSGTAAILTAMAVFRKVYHLEKYLTERQFLNLGRLLLALNLLYIYFTLSEYLTAWYGAEVADQRLLGLLMGKSPYGITFWLWAAFCLFLPAFIIGFPNRNNLIARLVVASVLINIGMWIKRYLIIVPTLMTPYIPADAGGVMPHYWPTWVEWTVTAGGLAFFLLLFTLFSKLFPIVSIWETVEGVEQIGAETIGVDLGPALNRPAFGWQPLRSTLLVPGLLFLTTVAGIGETNEPAQTQPASPPQIVLTQKIEDGETVLVATVTHRAGPKPGVPVTFYLQRTFGQLELGSQETQDDGTAILSLPAGFAAKQSDPLRVAAQITNSADNLPVRVEMTVTAVGAGTVAPDLHSFPRALWSPHAPLGLVLSIFTLLSVVWSTYLFVLSRLFKIWKSGNS